MVGIFVCTTKFEFHYLNCSMGTLNFQKEKDGSSPAS